VFVAEDSAKKRPGEDDRGANSMNNYYVLANVTDCDDLGI
jgi:hypothetical protein